MQEAVALEKVGQLGRVGREGEGAIDVRLDGERTRLVDRTLVQHTPEHEPPVHDARDATTFEVEVARGHEADRCDLIGDDIGEPIGRQCPPLLRIGCVARLHLHEAIDGSQGDRRARDPECDRPQVEGTRRFEEVPVVFEQRGQPVGEEILDRHGGDVVVPSGPQINGHDAHPTRRRRARGASSPDQLEGLLEQHDREQVKLVADLAGREARTRAGVGTFEDEPESVAGRARETR